MGIWTTKEMGNLPNEHEPWFPWSTPSAPSQARCSCWRYAKCEDGTLLSDTSIQHLAGEGDFLLQRNQNYYSWPRSYKPRGFYLEVEVALNCPEGEAPICDIFPWYSYVGQVFRALPTVLLDPSWQPSKGCQTPDPTLACPFRIDGPRRFH